MTNVEIFGFAPSTYTRTALLAAAEKGVPHTLSPVEFGAESHRALHPFARMPAMKHGDVHLYESAAIAVYLDEAFDGSSLQPAAPVDRARMWQLTSSAIDYFYGPLVRDMLGHAQGAAAPDPAERDRVLDRLEAAASGSDYLVGDAITLADLVIAPMVRFQVDSAEGENLLAKRPHLANWLNRLAERESFKALEAL
ncbi:MAG: glutathione S-transferase family protein [Hyphomicrobiales bacterium]|nr:glutathione S-transferase family protein [Hyphomicrobiales bacterium]